MLTKPQRLGNLHLETHCPTDKLQDAFTGAVDQVGFVFGTMISPEDDVAFALSSETFLFADADRYALRVDDSKRTSRIK